MRASDIHLEPLAKKFRVRYRIDGVMTEMKSPPKRLQPSIISRIKIQSNMSIASGVSRRMVVSRARWATIDRLARILPADKSWRKYRHAYFGQGSLRLGLPELGFFTDDQQTFEKLIALPDGILLVTAPPVPQNHHTLFTGLPP